MKHILYTTIILLIAILFLVNSFGQQYISKSTVEEEPLLGKRVKIINASAYDISMFSEEKIKKITRCPNPIAKNISIIISEQDFSGSLYKIPIYDESDLNLINKKCIVIEGYLCTEPFLSGLGDSRGVILNCDGKNAQARYYNIEDF